MSPPTATPPSAGAGGSEMLRNAGGWSRWMHPCHWDATAGMSQLTLILQGTLGGDRIPPRLWRRKPLGKV